MFTGIIEEKGIIKDISISNQGGNIRIACNKILENTKIGDSIAINGICLTVTKLIKSEFTADIMTETLKRSSLNELKYGSIVNLERALCLNHRLGGHIVSGHVDGTGKIINIEDNGIAITLTVETKNELLDEIIEKGSITIDGISLTVVTVSNHYFTVSLIPHTMQETNLQTKKIGSLVNLETDLIGKYVKKFLNTSKPTNNVTMDLLRENGFF